MKLTESILGTLVVAICATTATAQWQAASGYVSRVRGNSMAESRHEVEGVAVSSPFHAYARMQTTNRIKLLGASREAGSIFVSSYVNHHSGIRRVQGRLRVGGNDVRNLSFPLSIPGLPLMIPAANVFSTPPQTSIMIWFYQLTISAQAVAHLDSLTSLTFNYAGLKVRIAGRMAATVSGTARMVPGLSYAGTAINSQLDFGTASANMDIGAEPGRIAKAVTARFSSLSLRILVFAFNPFGPSLMRNLIWITEPEYSRRNFMS